MSEAEREIDRSDAYTSDVNADESADEDRFDDDDAYEEGEDDADDAVEEDDAFEDEDEDEEDDEDDDDDDDDEPTLDVSFELTEQDLVQLVKEQSRGSVKTAMIFGGLSLAFSGFAVVANWPVEPGLWIAFMLSSLVLLVATPGYYTRSARRSYSRIHPDQRRMRVTVDDDGFRLEGLDWSSQLSWGCLDGWAEYASAMTLTLGSELRVLPKRVLSERDVHLLMQRCQNHVAAPAPVTPKQKPGRTLLLWIFLIILFVAVYQLTNS